MARKAKRLTQKEKQRRAQLKKELQERGIIPPDKPRLNRRKFKEEVMGEWDKEIHLLDPVDALYLSTALSWMLAGIPSDPVTPEQVGIVKTMKLAVEIKRYRNQMKEQGLNEYSLKQEYDEVIRPVMEL